MGTFIFFLFSSKNGINSINIPLSNPVDALLNCFSFGLRKNLKIISADLTIGNILLLLPFSYLSFLILLNFIVEIFWEVLSQQFHVLNIDLFVSKYLIVVLLLFASGGTTLGAHRSFRTLVRTFTPRTQIPKLIFSLASIRNSIWQ